jgi:hypothetical protein
MCAASRKLQSSVIELSRETSPFVFHISHQVEDKMFCHSSASHKQVDRHPSTFLVSYGRRIGRFWALESYPIAPACLSHGIDFPSRPLEKRRPIEKPMPIAKDMPLANAKPSNYRLCMQAFRIPKSWSLTVSRKSIERLNGRVEGSVQEMKRTPDRDLELAGARTSFVLHSPWI